MNAWVPGCNVHVMADGSAVPCSLSQFVSANVSAVYEPPEPTRHVRRRRFHRPTWAVLFISCVFKEAASESCSLSALYCAEGVNMYAATCHDPPA